jgi:hypothetical protein
VLSEDEVLVMGTFLREGVRFLAVGGWAVQYYGHNRTRKDLDLLIETSPENVERLRKAFVSLGTDLADPREYTRLSEDRKVVVRVGYYPVEIQTAIDGVRFSDAWAGAELVTSQGVRFCVISKRHLITNKLSTARPRDLEDLTALQKVG